VYEMLPSKNAGERRGSQRGRRDGEVITYPAGICRTHLAFSKEWMTDDRNQASLFGVSFSFTSRHRDAELEATDAACAAQRP
jgi:hypothetical protein